MIVKKLITLFISIVLVSIPNRTLAQELLPGAFVVPPVYFSTHDLHYDLVGLSIDEQDPFALSFIINEENNSNPAFLLEDVDEKQLKFVDYFLAALTIPKTHLWVNLSPYEKNRIILEDFSKTDMGKVLLEQDYLLKQLTAKMLSPQMEVGGQVWDTLYDIKNSDDELREAPLKFFNKIWIVPDEATVYVEGNEVFVTESRLKVLFEEDYLALEANRDRTDHGVGNIDEQSLRKWKDSIKDTVRTMLIPEIEKEVNEGELFAPLRQVYKAVILAEWYKTYLPQSIVNRMYVGQSMISGIDKVQEGAFYDVYDQYVDDFSSGKYDVLREEYDPIMQELVDTKYSTGGVLMGKEDSAMLSGIAKEIPRSLLEQLSVTGKKLKVKLNIFDRQNKAKVDFGQTPEKSAMRVAAQWGGRIIFGGAILCTGGGCASFDKAPAPFNEGVEIKKSIGITLNSFEIGNKQYSGYRANSLDDVINFGHRYPYNSMFQVGDFDPNKHSMVYIHGAFGHPGQEQALMRRYIDEGYNLFIYHYKRNMDILDVAEKFVDDVKNSIPRVDGKKVVLNPFSHGCNVVFHALIKEIQRVDKEKEKGNTNAQNVFQDVDAVFSAPVLTGVDFGVTPMSNVLLWGPLGIQKYIDPSGYLYFVEASRPGGPHSRLFRKYLKDIDEVLGSRVALRVKGDEFVHYNEDDQIIANVLNLVELESSGENGIGSYPNHHFYVKGDMRVPAILDQVKQVIDSSPQRQRNPVDQLVQGSEQIEGLQDKALLTEEQFNKGGIDLNADILSLQTEGFMDISFPELYEFYSEVSIDGFEPIVLDLTQMSE